MEANLVDVCDRMQTHANKLQYGVLPGVDYVIQRFSDVFKDNPRMLEEIERVKGELITRPIMQAVNSVRSDARMLFRVTQGKIVHQT